VDSLLNVGQDVLDDFLHEDTVVTFSGHTRVRGDKSFRNAATAKEATTTGTFTANSGHLLEVPGDEGLGATKGTDLGMLLAGRVHEKVLGLVVTHVEYNSARQHWEESILL